MHSPVFAMLWESWRLTRVEAAGRLSLGIVAGSAALAGFAATPSHENVKDFGATVALVFIVTVNAPLWLSIAKLNGGRFLDGYRPGFLFHFLYTQPIRTVVLVGVPMAYDAVAAAALYLVLAILLGLTFGYPFPLLPLALWIAAFHVTQTTAQWATRNRIVQWLGAMAASTVFTVLAWRRGEQWPAQFEFSFADYSLMASIVLASFGLAVAGVARQRHGDAPVATPRLAASGGFSDWLVNLFQFPCPRSSATRAQVWFDLKSTGLPGLTIVLACAMVNPLLFAIGGPVAPLRPYAVMFAGFSVLVVLFLGGNAFGVRRRQGRIYASVFETTQARGTGPLAALKVLVRTVCMLAALVAIGASLWASLSLVSAWGKDAPGFMQLQHSIEIAVGGLTGYQQVAVAVVTFIAAAVIVASRAALEALRARIRVAS
jgi:hypothetical protein